MSFVHPHHRTFYGLRKSLYDPVYFERPYLRKSRFYGHYYDEIDSPYSRCHDYRYYDRYNIYPYYDTHDYYPFR